MSQNIAVEKKEVLLKSMTNQEIKESFLELIRQLKAGGFTAMAADAGVDLNIGLSSDDGHSAPGVVYYYCEGELPSNYLNLRCTQGKSALQLVSEKIMQQVEKASAA